MPSFAGRSALVTGAANGIGRGTAQLLESLGARVVAVDRDQDTLNDVFREGRFTTYVGDLAAAGIEQLADEIWSRDGPIDMLVNNVGIHVRRRFFDLDPDDFDLTLNTNLRGPWFFTRSIARHLIEEGRTGAIVFVSSLHDHAVATHPHYSASKAAVSMLVKELAVELAPHGIRVNAVSPGPVRSASNPLGDDPPVRVVVPLGRVGEPADVARMTAVLLSEDWSSYVTGVNVPVDGGISLLGWPSHTTGRGRSAFKRWRRRRSG